MTIDAAYGMGVAEVVRVGGFIAIGGWLRGITHIAWATRASRQRLLDEAVENVAAFLRGERRNVVE